MSLYSFDTCISSDSGIPIYFSSCNIAIYISLCSIVIRNFIVSYHYVALVGLSCNASKTEHISYTDDTLMSLSGVLSSHVENSSTWVHLPVIRQKISKYVSVPHGAHAMILTTYGAQTWAEKLKSTFFRL